MQLHGHNLIGFQTSEQGGETSFATYPTASEGSLYQDATDAELDRAAQLAKSAFSRYQNNSPETRAGFLEGVANALERQGDVLVPQAELETHLGLTRLRGELARTTGQLRMFAELVREGSWVDARIDHADPERNPLPKPDVRRMLVPLGPVAVFSASNFPFAFSVAGGDTASALAVGCPVIVKAHPAHPRTSEMVGRIVLEVAQELELPDGTFSLLYGTSHEVSLALVRHPAVQAVGFTGSLQGGQALFDAAAKRPQPIPVFAEMGSVNPVFLLPKVLAARAEALAVDFIGSVTLGVGQFCTNPGLVVALDSPELSKFTEAAAHKVAEAEPGRMLYESLKRTFDETTARWLENPQVSLVSHSGTAADSNESKAHTFLFSTTARAYLAQPLLHQEVFGPSTLIVKAADRGELLEVANTLEGQLTATIHGEESELVQYQELVQTLQMKAGRLIFNGFPTGVEVGSAMQHGGPYPATTDSRATSVGTAAVYRFVRPVCFQDFPQANLPPELKDANPRRLLRLIDGVFKRSEP